MQMVVIVCSPAKCFQMFPEVCVPLCSFLLFFRDFLIYLQRYKSFFAALPEMLCEGDNVVDDSTCWSGDDVVER